MGFVVSEQIWQYVERLYIHCYKADGFIDFLKSKNISLPQDFYSNRDISAIMSTDSRDFAHFMQGVPSYRYLPLLGGMIFDSNIRDTQLDGTDYFGIYVKGWYPQLIDQIQRAGLIIDSSESKIYSDETDSEAVNGQDLLVINFSDIFLNHIKKEINECYNNGHYLAVMILSRKLAECLFIRIFEVVFRKHDADGAYNGSNHALWFNVTINRIHDFDTLLQNLKDNAVSFQEDRAIIEEICVLIKPFKNEVNQVVHRDYKVPIKESVDKWDISGIFSKLGKIYRKYCNP